MSAREILPSSEESESGSLEDSESSRELDESTHEPGAYIEQSGDIQTAETIEAHLTNLSDAQVAQEEQGSGSGKESFGTETYDPQKSYSGVQMTQGEVLEDEDWNEDSGDVDPSTFEGMMKKLDATLAALDEEREKGLEKMKDIQAANEKLLERESARLKDKYGSDDPRTPHPKEVSSESLDSPEAHIPLNGPIKSTQEDIMVDPSQLHLTEDDEDNDE